MSQPKITPDIARQRYLAQNIQVKIDRIQDEIDAQSQQKNHEPFYNIPCEMAQPEVIQGLKDLKWNVVYREFEDPTLTPYYYITW